MNTDSRICNRTKMKLSYVCVAVVHVRNSTENERKKNRLRCVHHRQPTTNNGIDNVEQKAKPKANCNAISSSHTFNSMFIIPFECDAAYTLYLGRLSPPPPPSSSSPMLNHFGDVSLAVCCIHTKLLGSTSLHTTTRMPYGPHNLTVHPIPRPPEQKHTTLGTTTTTTANEWNQIV